MRMTKKPAFVAALLCAFAAGTHASEWITIESGRGMRTDFDKASLTHSGPVVKVWLRTVWNKPTRTSPGLPKITEWRGRYSINCETRRVSNIQLILSNRGTPLMHLTKPTAFTVIVSDTPMEHIADILCVRHRNSSADVI